MNRLRFTLIIAITLLVMATVIATRLYEYVIQIETPTKALVRAGYQRFRKATNGFNFRYPIGWRYEAQVSTDDYINGFFYNKAGESQMYLEAPYGGHEFELVYRGGEPYYSPTPGQTPQRVSIVSTTIFNTNDPGTPVILNIYRPCVSVSTTTGCILSDSGGFAAGHWQRKNISPVLDLANKSAQSGVLYVSLPVDKIKENFLISQLKIILGNFRFNNSNEVQTNVVRWNIYHDKKFGFSFSYPEGYKLSENVDLSYAFMATGTILDFPDSFKLGTNLSEARILFGPVVNGSVGPNCLPENGISSPAEQVSINGVKYFRSVGAGAAVGNRYDTISYGISRGGVCFNITLFLHSTVLENYDESNRPKAFDKDAVISAFNGIFATFIN